MTGHEHVTYEQLELIVARMKMALAEIGLADAGRVYIRRNTVMINDFGEENLPMARRAMQVAVHDMDIPQACLACVEQDALTHGGHGVFVRAAQHCDHLIAY